MADYLKIPEVARRLDVSEKTARRYVRDGTLPSVFVGGAYRVSEEDLEAYLKGARVQPEERAGKKGEAPKRGAQPHSDPTPISTNDVVYAIDMMVGLRAEAPRYAAKWAKHLENLIEGGQLPEQPERELVLIANTMQDEFMRGFETIGQAALVEGRSTPYEWPQNIKDLVLEAGAHVQAAAETALRISEECTRRSNTREKVLAEEFSVGRMPEELTGDPGWNEALEEARAVR